MGGKLDLDELNTESVIFQLHATKTTSPPHLSASSCSTAHSRLKASLLLLFFSSTVYHGATERVYCRSQIDERQQVRGYQDKQNLRSPSAAQVALITGSQARLQNDDRISYIYFSDSYALFGGSGFP